MIRPSQVTSQAFKDDRVDGLLLFSPGFYSDSQYLFLAPAISYFWDWLDIDDEDNIVTYQSLSSRFVWYGDTPPHLDDPRVTALTSYLPDRRISNFSHMNVLFAPDNPYYGEAGSYTMLENGQEDLDPPDEADALWFSAWGA